MNIREEKRMESTTDLGISISKTVVDSMVILQQEYQMERGLSSIKMEST